MVRHAKYDSAHNNKPFILVEYAHAMGNTDGNFNDYWDTIRKYYPKMQGGYIWDFVDQGFQKITDRRDTIWSYGGEREYSNVSNTFLQPFLSYTWPDTTNLGLNTESTYNWTSKQWTVPINLTAGHLFSLGRQRVNFTLGGRYYPERPHDGASWGLRFVMTFLFPK